MSMNAEHSDFLVIGSGLAGLAFALKAATIGRVLVLSKEKVESTNTAWAQGGIASVTASDDDFGIHLSDTLQAGAGLCRDEAVRNIIEQGPDRIQDLRSWGVHFDPHLTREGGHSRRRILHFEDHTGKEIHRALLAACRLNPNIRISEEEFAIDLITNRQVNPWQPQAQRCLGAYVYHRTSGQVRAVLARETILATGGAGKVYLYTSNWSGATGDGIAMAYRAGCRVANLEFMQFHPTCLYHPQARNFLISEALRGEGGELINAKGEAFLKDAHPLGSLAPRDIVARGIDAEMKRSGSSCVYLDMTRFSESFLREHFPVIFEKCLSFGIHLARDPIPVVPAAHYLCGGVLADVRGKTDLENLWCLGETACTGLHGANRLASNSLLECLAMAHNCAEYLRLHLNRAEFSVPPDWQDTSRENEDEMIVVKHMWEEIRHLMWNYVGIVRTNKRLERAMHRLRNIREEVREYYWNFRMHPDLLELRNIALVAELTVQCALLRQESRGIHFNLDYPDMQPGPPKDTIL